MSAALRVVLNGNNAGVLRRKANGNLQFQYNAEYVARGGRAISYALPVSTQRFSHRTCLAVFGGLLPEQDVRLAIARLRGISPTNDYRLLEELGGDCAGALQFFVEPAGEAFIEEKHRPRVRAISADELDDVLRELPRRPLAMLDENSARLSLAGAQDKLPIILRNGSMYLPLRDGPPTTHIIKPEPERFPGLVHNEYTCMTLAKRLGLNAATVSMQATLTGLPYLLVERYDRTRTGDQIARVHQEDVCQALARLPHEKYQAEGGPSVSETAQLIRSSSAAPAVDIPRLWDAIVFNVLIGNCDAHGKNYSLLYAGRRATLAPLYDLVSTSVYPELSDRLAMTIGGATKLSQVDIGALEQCARDSGLAPRSAMVRARILARHAHSHAEVMRAHASTTAETAKQVLAGVVERAAALASL